MTTNTSHSNVGVSWDESEHLAFLKGLQVFGKVRLLTAGLVASFRRIRNLLLLIPRMRTMIIKYMLMILALGLWVNDAGVCVLNVGSMEANQ
jgi:hypothetical protein